MHQRIAQLGFLSFLFHFVTTRAEKTSLNILRWFERANATSRMESSVSSDHGAVCALQLDDSSLEWFRLDDGIMGGQSQTSHCAENEGRLHFRGIINTNGGGFASIRSKAPKGFIKNSSTGIQIRYRGDGKTYKVILSEGNRGSGNPTVTPSWQIDLPTTASSDDDDWQEAMLPFRDFKPTFGGRRQSRPSAEELAKLQFDPTSMREIGLMLSLYRAGGVPNPTSTFGEGIFPFSLQVQRISVEQWMD